MSTLLVCFVRSVQEDTSAALESVVSAASSFVTTLASDAAVVNVPWQRCLLLLSDARYEGEF